MFFWLFIVLIALLIYYFVSHHVHVDYKSLFKKGFIKNDSYFGLYCYTGKQRDWKNL